MKKQDGIFLDSKFWSNFSKTTWEKKSVLIKNFHSPLRAFDENEVFKLLLVYANHCRKTKNPEGFKFYIAGERVYETETLKFLPLEKDQSLTGYHNRMNKLFTDYCLVCDELLQVNSKYLSDLDDFTSELYKHVGFPNRFCEIGLYIGNYRKTPFGVHADGCGVFSFPVVGEKQFRIWSAEFVRSNPALAQAFKYSKYKKNSQLLSAQPGDMTYWPSSAWHIAESQGQFSATWSLGVWVDRPFSEQVCAVVSELLTEQLGGDAIWPTTPFAQLHKENGELAELPLLYRNSITKLKDLSPTQLHESFSKAWLKHISKKGFKTTPKVDGPLPKFLELQNKNSPLLWAKSKNRQTLTVCFAGVSVELPQSRNLSQFLAALNAGARCRLDDFFENKDRAKFRKAFHILFQAGAFAILP